MTTVLAEIDAAYATFARERGVPGIVAGIVEGGRLVHVTTFGLADVEAGRPTTRATAFRIASMTKSVTALAILLLRDRGRLVLDAPLAQYVPQFAAVPPATGDSPPVSLRHLLTHTAGFVTDDPWGDRMLGMAPARLDELMKRGRLFARPPGIAFEYSNLGYALLGRAITNVSGEPYQSFIRRSILEPLGTTRTTFDALAAARDDFAWGYRRDGEVHSRERLEPDGEVGAMGGLVTTTDDYARYVAFLLDAWPARDGPETGPVARASVRELTLFHAPPYLAEAMNGQAATSSAYGYGMVSAADAVLGRRLNHSGGLPGYGSHMLLLPDRGIGVFAFGNRTYPAMSHVVTRVAAIYCASRPKPPPAPPSPWLKRAVEAVVAAYAAGRIEVAEPVFAENLLLDMPAPLRNAELAALKRKLGEGRLGSIVPDHALACDFFLACANGRLKIGITLSPDEEPGIQELEFEVEDVAMPPP